MKITKEQIQEWKQKYGEIFKLKIEDKECYLRKPSRKTLSYASVAGKDNPLGFNEVIMRDVSKGGCWLGGDEEVREDDTLFLSASSKIAELIEIKDAELEKL